MKVSDSIGRIDIVAVELMGRTDVCEGGVDMLECCARLRRGTSNERSARRRICFIQKKTAEPVYRYGGFPVEDIP
jgi:hypothetical protein